MRKVLLVLSLMSSMLVGCNDPEAQVEQEGHEAPTAESQIDDTPTPAADPAPAAQPAPVVPAAEVAAPATGPATPTAAPAAAPVVPAPTAGQ